uniref:Protein kinase domain-containing protein n=1 Tax=Globodera rostochiensis TaxID=31243 RepID=A0A914HJE6_GLORO
MASNFRPTSILEVDISAKCTKALQKRGTLFCDQSHRLESVSASFRQNFLPRELRIWQELNHPNHVYLYKDLMKSGYVFEIMELAVGGNMLTYVQDRGPIAEMAYREWMLQLIDALLENILIFDGGVIKISDYGFSKKSVDLSSTFCGSRSYVAPEILQGIEHDMFKVLTPWTICIVIKLPTDLKLENILIFDVCVIKMSDYGFSKKVCRQK